ncbi:MAG: outer membrane protein assembly factor BamD [Phaeodactylibacter sp.]|nr:outer membrane protein assembly factor BamD [Phaeodactylibacter sp.]
MKKTVGWNVVVVLFLLSITACKSEYERIRLSGDPQTILDKGLSYYEDREYLKAQGLFELVLPAYRGKKELEDIYFKYAYSYYYLGQYILASYYFKNFSNTFSTSLLREEADFMAAYSNFKLSPSYRLDQSYSEQAIEGFQLFVNTYPDSDRVEECNRLIDIMRNKMEEKAFAAAELYYNLRQYQAATQSFENLLKDFPETENAEQVRYMIVKSAYFLADNSIFEKRRERYKEAEKYANEYLAKFTGSDNLKEVQSILDDCEKKLKSIQDGGYQKQGAGARS